MNSDPCPCCGWTERFPDYAYNGEDEMRVDRCERCEWPPSSIMSPEEWRVHPNNPMVAVP